MFSIEFGENGEILCSGRLDAAQCAKAEEFLGAVDSSSTLDFAQLEYISSAGLKIINVNNHIHDVFRYSGFHSIFEIEAG